jgi:NADH-quinone oxidoreductase subunit M
LWLVVAAVLIRKGIFPVHAWIPEAFEHGRLGPSVLFGAPQLGTYVAATVVFPLASPTMLQATATLALITAIYGAALSAIQRDARRACGYLFISQSSLVLAGVASASEQALAGALVLWMASALGFTGFARIVLALEARRGRLDLRTHHGGLDQMPVLAASFLVLGLACTGFPGTLGFVAQELLIDGVVQGFPLMGFLTVGASAFTGLSILRMYFSLFCGSRTHTPATRLLRREAITFGAVASLLVVTGMAPKLLLESRLRASEAMFRQRDAQAVRATENDTESR